MSIAAIFGKITNRAKSLGYHSSISGDFETMTLTSQIGFDGEFLDWIDSLDGVRGSFNLDMSLIIKRTLEREKGKEG